MVKYRKNIVQGEFEIMFFICRKCGNLVEMVSEKRGSLVCCGQKMELLEANTSDGATEKHVPVVAVDGNKVSVDVGSVAHPMLDNHYIQWIYVKTDKGVLRKHLAPGQEPKAEFVLADGENLVEVYEYCNLHGLWKK